jgi:hypothetical protein
MNAQQLNNENAQSVARVRTSFRVLVGISVALVVVIALGVFIFGSIAEVRDLFERGLRRDALLLIVIRDLSLATVISCGGYLLCSFIFNLTTRQRVVALGILVVFAFSFAISGYTEQRLRSRVQDNLQQLHSALDDYERNHDAAEDETNGQ